jgi:hypothetical protein
MFSIHPHIEAHIPTETHVNAGAEHPNLEHSSTLHTPASVSSAGGFPSSASGHPSGLLSHLGDKPPASNLTFVKVAGDANSYVIKDTSNTRTPQPLYAKSDAGSLKQTPKMGVYDGLDGVRLDNGLRGGVGDPPKNQRPDAFQAYLDSYNPNAGTSSSRHSSGTRQNTYSPSPTASHSFSERGAWNNPSTAGSSAPPLPPRNAVPSSSSTGSGHSNAMPSSSSTGQGRSNAVPSSSSADQGHSNVFGFGPLPDSRYLKETGDGQSKFWLIRDGRGGTKPADSSIDKYGRPAHVYQQGERKGKAEWTGPSNSVLAPRKE